MALTIRVQLTTGKTHRFTVDFDEPAEVIKRLKNGQAPFSAEWLEADDGELVRMSAIVSAYIEPAGSNEPFVAFG